MLPLLGLNANKKEFLKSTSNLHITLSLELKRYVHTFMHSLENHTYPNSDPDGQSPYLFSDPESGAKTLPFGAAHTHKVNIREYPPGNIPRVWPNRHSEKCSKWQMGRLYHRERRNYL